MAKSQSRGADTGKTGRSPADGWAKLTWDDLEGWAGSRSVSRGRTYQRGGWVKNLKISADGDLLATVEGGERYATTVALGPGRKRAALESSCTCPVGVSCKHAVATVAEYLEAVAEGREVPIASEDDPRWAKLEDEGAGFDDDWDEDEDDEGSPWDDEDAGAETFAYKPARSPGRSAPRASAEVNWDGKIEQHLRAKSQGELADLVWSLTRRFPEVYQEFRERIALQEGDVDRLLEEARREIRRVTAEPAWRNHWNDEGHIPDYSRIRHRFERLLELGHADEVVSLGREFIREGIRQVGESHDEGETVTAFAECLPVVFQAVARSSLSVPERLLFAIDAELADDFDAIDDASAAVFDAPASPEDWSEVADVLTGRLKPASAGGGNEGDRFSRHYHRDQVTNWIASALRDAGRDGEIRALYESEAQATWSYERLVKHLLEARQFEDAERWAKEGIAATSEKYPGIGAQLAESLCELARKRKQWDVVAAHAAVPFFERPGLSTFDELMKAAAKAKVEDAVRAAALRFLETGAAPFQVISPAAVAPPRAKSSAGRRSAASSPEPKPKPKPPAPDRLKIDPAWPLPMPDYLVPLLHRPGRYDPGPRPHLGVLLEMAIAAKRPDEVLRWFDKMRAGKSQNPGYYDGPSAYADRVAAAVSAAYPERAIDVYLTALNGHLPRAEFSAYEAATGYLKKLRPIYESLDRAGEWAALLASIREKYRNRPRFMEMLDRLDGRTIVASTRTKQK